MFFYLPKNPTLQVQFSTRSGHVNDTIAGDAALAAAPAPAGDIVIGLEYEGVVQAYPRNILVHHEIVTHEIGGENLAVTYCPLTATAQAFKTGTTTMGASGRPTTGIPTAPTIPPPVTTGLRSGSPRARSGGGSPLACDETSYYTR